MEDTKKLIEKYKRELMELSKSAQPSARESRSTEEKSVKKPRIIGYVTEESSEFPAVFDRYITEAVENNEAETIKREDPDYLNMPDGTDIPDEDGDGVGEDDVIAVPKDFFNDNARDNPGNGNDPDRPNAEDNMDQGTGESISNFAVPEYSNLSEFESNNRGGGTLEFRVFAAREALPIENASVVVSARINGKNHEMYNTLTDNSGETTAQTLPAPSKELSQSAENRIQPFSLYDATVEKNGFAKVILRDIPIFDGVQSIQRVAMIPETELGGASENVEIREVRNAE